MKLRLGCPLGAAVMAFSLPATSAPDDVWQPYVADTYSYYSNLFLVPGDTPPNTPGILDPKRSDRFNQTEAGFTYNQDFGLQNVQATARVTRTDFEHFTQIDYTGKDLEALWNWKIQNVLQGTLGATDSRTLPAYTDFHLQERNLIDESREYGSADLMVTPHWRIHTGFNRDDTNFELDAERLNDNTSNTKEAGLDYVASTRSSIGLLVRHVDGNYPNYVENDGEKANNSYTQNEYKINLDWHLSENSNLTFLGGYVQRTGDILPSLDVYGFNGRIVYDWTPRDKLKLNLTGWHEYTAIQSGEIGYSINTGISTEATWDVTNKIHLVGKLKYEKRDFYVFASTTSSATANVTPYYDDATNNATMLFKYEPRQYLELVAMITHDLRSANIPLEGFVGNGASISANLKF